MVPEEIMDSGPALHLYEFMKPLSAMLPCRKIDQEGVGRRAVRL